MPHALKLDPRAAVVIDYGRDGGLHTTCNATFNLKGPWANQGRRFGRATCDPLLLKSLEESLSLVMIVSLRTVESQTALGNTHFVDTNKPPGLKSFFVSF